MKDFEDIIKLVGCAKYQQRLLYIILGPLFFLLPLSWLNEIFLLKVPDHWCYHPSQAKLNSTQLEQWKQCNLPEIMLSKGAMGPSPCRILISSEYKGHEDDFWNATDLGCPSEEKANVTTIKCTMGFTFDQSEFSRTVASDNDWVCENDQYVPQLFTWGIIGSILGTIVFSYLGDVIGRRFVFWLSTAMVVFFMAVKTFLTDYFYAYLAFKVLAASAYVATFQMPFSIITEISTPDYRSWAVGVTCATWTVGLCLLPLVGWLSGDWFVISLVTVLPMLILFVGWKFVPESPRWLLTRGRKDEAAAIIREIARVNGNPEPMNLDQRLQKIVSLIAQEKNYGYISLFSRRRLAKKTLLMTVALVASNFLYYQLMLNIGNMAGNTFLNFFLLSVIEGPACFIAVYLAEWMGRRWSHTLLLTLNTLCLLANTMIANRPELYITVTMFCLLAKFICTATFVIVYVQCIELFPTCIRNTGMGFTSLLAMVIGIGGPYVIHLGTIDVRIPYGIMALMCLFGAIAASFLPETNGVALPESIQDAAAFGKNQNYFSTVRVHNRNVIRHNEAQERKDLLQNPT